MSVEEYLALIQQLQISTPEKIEQVLEVRDQIKPRKKRSSAYSRKYKAAFKKVKSDYMTSKGTWKKGGFRRAVKAAHKEAKR